MKLSKKFFAIAIPALVGTAFAAQYNFQRTAGEKATLQQTHQPTLRHEAVTPQEAPYRAEEASLPLITSFPKNESEYNTMTFVDVESDGNGTYNQWTYTTTTDADYNSIAAMLIYPTSTLGSSAYLDDWAFIPVDFTSEAADMSFSVDSKTQYAYSSDDYTYEVKFGAAATPEAMTTDVLSVSNYRGKGWKTFSGEFSVEGAGRYYIGIHATYKKSLAGKLWLSNVNLSMTPKAVSNIGPDGEILNMHPTEEEFNDCTIVDANGDGVTLTYNVTTSSSGTEYDWPIMYNNVKATQDADEWLITPVITIPSIDKIYTVSVEAYATGTYYSEAFEVAIGRTPDVASMTKIILDAPVVSNHTYQPYTARFGVAEAGKYYVGLHVKSTLNDGWRIALRNLKVYQLDESAYVPSEVSNVTITPDAKGELKAAVSFTLPDTYLNSLSIPADEEITATVTTSEDSVELTGKPGQTLSTTIGAAEGLSTVSIVTKNVYGEGGTVNKSVRCGLDEPVAPNVSSTVSDDNMTININWEPVSTGANGGVVDPDGVTYAVYQYITTDDTSGWYLLKSGIQGTSYSYTASDTTQTLYEFLVSAANAKGDSDGDYNCYTSAVLGTPDTLPIEETFPNGGLTYPGLCIDYPSEDYYASWALDDPSLMADECANESGYALMCMNQYDGSAKARVSLTKFSTVGHSRVRLVISAFVYSVMPEVDVYIEDNMGVSTKIGTINGDLGYGWMKIPFDLPEEFNNRSNLKAVLETTISNTVVFFAMDGYRFYERTSKDLSVSSVSFPSYMKLGDEGTVTAYVESLGFEDVATPTLTAKILNGRNVVAETELTTTAGATLSEGDKVAYTGSISFDDADLLNKYLTLWVELPDEDNDKTNNSASVSFKVGMSGTPMIIDLTATQNATADAIDLKWTAPFENGYVDYMEGYTAFDCNGVIGPWKNIDFDGKATYTFDGVDIPNAISAKAFMVLNDYEMGYDGALYLPSGNQCLGVFSAQESESDDWLISPEVVGGSTVSFYATPLSADYQESFEIMYSTTDDDADSFKSLQSETTGAADWVLYTVKLPEDAKYFAIHYVSEDMFGLLIDDITYSPVDPEITVDGYELYRDNANVGHLEPGNSYSDSNVELGNTYSYNVAATGTYSGIKLTFPMSNTASCKLTGVDGVSSTKAVFAGKGEITVLGYAGAQVKIYNAAGMTLVNETAASDNLRYALESGNYIVVVGGRTSKLYVR